MALCHVLVGTTLHTEGTTLLTSVLIKLIIVLFCAALLILSSICFLILGVIGFVEYSTVLTVEIVNNIDKYKSYQPSYVLITTISTNH